MPRVLHHDDEPVGIAFWQAHGLPDRNIYRFPMEDLTILPPHLRNAMVDRFQKVAEDGLNAAAKTRFMSYVLVWSSTTSPSSDAHTPEMVFSKILYARWPAQ